MRLTTVILLGTMLHLSAATFGQKLNYVNKNVSLEQLFKEIKKQTNYNVVWYEGKLNTARTINANFSNASLDQVMDKALNGLPLTYTIRQNNIVIKEKTPSLIDKVISHFKNATLFGKVTDERGNPLPGATIRIKDTKTAVLSNKDGNFSIESKETNGVLFISFLGYKPTEISFSPTNPGPFTVTLKEDESILNEVQINAGYYTVSDRERTGSISKITAETIEKQPVNNVLLALQGNIPGVQISQSSGVPGSAFTVRIRGQNSLKSGNDPLYIIDGVPYPSTGISSNASASMGTSPLSMINPGDIESIEVLKDADATAIYGSRGANGVILISTKKGSENINQINANYSIGFSEVGHKIRLLNTDEYLQMRREAFKNDGLTPSSTQYDINGKWDQHKYTDWQKELIGGTAPITNASLNILGGNSKSSYLIAGNYYKEGTVFPGDFGFKRLGIRSNIDLSSSDNRFKASLTLNLNHEINNIAPNITESIFLPPNAPDLLDEYGGLNWANNTVYTNPLASILRTNKAESDGVIGNVVLSYKICNNLMIKTSLGYNTIKRQELLKTPLSSYPPVYGYTSAQRTSLFSNNFTNNFIAEPQLTYKSKIWRGNIDALVGMSLQDSKSQISSIRASDFNSDDLLENIGSASLLSTEQNQFSQYRYIATFARLNYGLSDKYFVNLTARRDGSSRFGGNKQFANFGAIGTAWLFSEETWIKKELPFLSFGKIRASYGITGNDQIGDYGYLQLWDTGAIYDGKSTVTPGYRAANVDFSWETNRKLEGAIQLGFLKNRINLEISFYRNRSSNLLLDKPLSLSTGQSSIYQNLPAEVQNIGWEFVTKFKIFNVNKFQWTTELNLTIPKNKLLSYPGLESSNDASFYKIGEPLNILKVYNTTVNKQTGLYEFEDKNGSKTLDNGDRYLTKFLGQNYYGGLQNSIHYDAFSLDFLFSFAKQNGRRFDTTYGPGRFSAGSTSNQYSEVFTRWQNPGDESEIQKFSTISANTILYNSNKNYGSLSVVNASFIRLRNVSLSYSVPKRLLSNLKIKNASFYLQAQNLFTLTKYIGLDPETQFTALPPLRTINLGLSITF